MINPMPHKLSFIALDNILKDYAHEYVTTDKISTFDKLRIGDIIGIYKIKVNNYNTTSRLFDITIYHLTASGRTDVIRKTKTKNYNSFARKNNISIIEISPTYANL